MRAIVGRTLCSALNDHLPAPYLPWLALVGLGLTGLSAAAPPAPDDSFTPTFHPHLDIGRAAGPIAIDGLLDDEGWRGAARAAEFSEHNPGDEVRPPVDTEVLVTYDADNLYAAWICHDDPLAVRATYTERDRIWSDDYVIMLLDTYADQTWSYEIAANPYGVQGDLLWSTNYGEDLSYDLIFETAGRVTERGYVVEMAIPFTSLRFPDRAEQDWRVDFWRNHPRAVRGQYSWSARDRNDPCWACSWGTLAGIRDVRPGRGVELLPALVFTQASTRNEAGAFIDGDVLGAASLGGKYSLSSSFTAEGTLNPDFSQVESDAAQIDVNTTFALFYPERRPFFQEGSDLFNTWFTAVYTRSINDPLFAAKLIGRPGRTNIAYLIARDEHTPFTLPFADATEFASAGRSVSNILRARHALGEQSHVGLIATDRRLDDGGSGTVLGADTSIRLDQNRQFELQLLATHTDEPDEADLTSHFEVAPRFDRGARTSAFDGERYWGHALYTSLEHSSRHLGVDLDYWERGATFRVENGFEQRNDRRETSVAVDYTFYDVSKLVDRLYPGVRIGRVWDTNGVRKDEWIWSMVGARLQWAQTTLQASYLMSNELFQGVQFDGINGWEFEAELHPADALQGGLSVTGGHRVARNDLVMGDEHTAVVWADVKPTDRLLAELVLRYARSDDIATGVRLFDGYIARGRFAFQFTRTLSTRLVLQYDYFHERWEADPLVTLRLNPFSIFYVGSTRDYNDLSLLEDGVQGWNLTDRQYFMKLQYLFQM